MGPGGVALGSVSSPSLPLGKISFVGICIISVSDHSKPDSLTHNYICSARDSVWNLLFLKTLKA